MKVSRFVLRCLRKVFIELEFDFYCIFLEMRWCYWLFVFMVVCEDWVIFVLVVFWVVI